MSVVRVRWCDATSRAGLRRYARLVMRSAKLRATRVAVVAATALLMLLVVALTQRPVDRTSAYATSAFAAIDSVADADVDPLDGILPFALPGCTTLVVALLVTAVVTRVRVTCGVDGPRVHRGRAPPLPS